MVRNRSTVQPSLATTVEPPPLLYARACVRISVAKGGGRMVKGGGRLVEGGGRLVADWCRVVEAGGRLVEGGGRLVADWWRVAAGGGKPWCCL